MERLIDMAARRLAIDPAELRLRNLIRAEEFPYKVASGIVWDRSGFVESVTSACAAIGYAKLRDEQAKARDEGRLAGVGIATYAELTGIGSRISAAPGMPINTGMEAATIRLRHTLFLGTVWSSNQTRLGRHASMPTGIERDTDARRKPTKRAQHPEILA